MAGDWKNITDDREKYQAYLCSREWAERREAVRARADGVCERCSILPMDAVHHLTYARKYEEPLEDLQAICTPCHKFIHGKSNSDPSRELDFEEFAIGTTETCVVLICPVCGCFYSHISRVFTRLGRDPGEALVYDGTDDIGHSTFRRSSLVIEISGECEHNWEVEIQQHKGHNLIWANTLPQSVKPVRNGTADSRG